MAYLTYSQPLDANEEHVIGILHAGPADNVVGIVFSDKNGTLHIEQSADGGTNWDLDEEIAVTGGTGKSFSVAIYGSAVQLRYVNGAAAQTEFRIAAKTSSAGPR